MYTSRPQTRQPSLSRRSSGRSPGPRAGLAPGLTAQQVEGWLTLQTLCLSQSGVCTDPDMFFHHEGAIFVSDLDASLLLNPGTEVTFDTAFNLFGLEALDKTCRLGRLAFAIRGAGEVEVSVFQSFAGRSQHRVFSDIVTLTPHRESVFDLDRSGLDGGLDGREGVLWVQVRAINPDQPLRVDHGRFLTDTVANPDIRLAICRPQPEPPNGLPQPDTSLARILGWAQMQQGRVSVLTCGATPHAADDLIELPAAASRHAAHLALLVAAKERGFTHVLMTDPTTILSPQALQRTLICLSILQDDRKALGATLLDGAVAWKLAQSGLTRTPDGKLAPFSSQVDLRQTEFLLDAEYDAALVADAGLIQPQSGFVAFALAALPADLSDALVPARSGLEEVTCLREGLVHLRQMPGMIARRTLSGTAAQGLMTLQNLIFPEQNLCTEHLMYFHGDGRVQFDKTLGVITVENNGLAIFDTYFNLLSIAKWHQNCALNGLWLGVSGRGRVAVRVFHALRGRSWEVLSNTIATLSKGQELLIDLSHYADEDADGVIFFEVQALGEGVQVSAARYMTEAVPNPDCRLALSVTTFRREAQVENTARRFAAYFDRAEYAPQMDCLIVDNGDSANIISHPKITRIPNRNLGGAGGFTRGLLEAEARGYSHIVFMDDDASIPLEALSRTYAFLSLAKNPKAAIAGAMINTTDKWRMCENGAIFDRKCYPQFGGTDLRERDPVLHMEYESALQHSNKMYGGWWFFAFRIDQVERHPFPFFVRGDDVNFSLVNNFAITTLNGVVSFADDFVDKESPMTWYLDLRSHLVHHLTLDKMEVGRFRLAQIGLSFFKRNLLKFQYETIEAVLMAWENVLQGPDFFTANADATKVRAAIKALTRNETFHPLADLDLTHKTGFLGRRGRLRRWFYGRTMNGHFLPFFGLWGSKWVVPASQRGDPTAMLGAVQLTYLNTARDKGYTTRRNNLRALRLLLRLASVWVRTVLSYDRLRALYHRRYPEITTPQYWRGALALPPVVADLAPKQP